MFLKPLSPSPFPEVIETGVAYLSLADLERVALAKGYYRKIEGSQRPVVYEQKDIAKGFTENLGKFYAQYVK
jgi:hypothetical protein